MLHSQNNIDQTWYRMFQNPMAVQDAQVIKPLSKRTNDISFALAQFYGDFSCGFGIVLTEHPKLIIFETILRRSFANNKIRKTKLEIFTYINYKFVYVEKHNIRSQMKN